MSRRLRIASIGMLGAGVIGVSGCGNADTTDVFGQTALAQNAQGDVIAVVKLCKDNVNEIDVNGSREGLTESATNPNLGGFKASEPVGGTFEVNLSHPAGPWMASQPLAEPKAPTKSWIVSARSTDKDAVTQQVSATPEQVRELAGGDVLVDEGKVVTRKVFEDKACEGS